MNKKAKVIIMVILLMLIIFSLVAVMIFSISSNNFKHIIINHKVSNNIVHEEVYENDFNEISIDTDAADIKIKKSTDDKIKLVIYADEEKQTIKVNNLDDLDINIKNKSKIGFFNINYTSSKIELYLPENFDDTIDIDSDFGDIDIASFSNLNLSLEGDCGDVNIKKANDVKMDIDCGDIEIGTVNDLFIESDLSDIEVEQINNYINIKSDLGDIDIDNVTLSKNSSIISNLGDISIQNISNVFIDAEVDLGEISINNNSKRSDIILKVESDLGDVDVN